MPQHRGAEMTDTPGNPGEAETKHNLVRHHQPDTPTIEQQPPLHPSRAPT